MKNFLQGKVVKIKVDVMYIPETEKKVGNGITIRNPGSLSVWIITTTKPLFRRHVEKGVWLGIVETVFGYEIFFRDASEIKEKINILAPWATEFFERTLQRIRENQKERFSEKKEKVE